MTEKNRGVIWQHPVRYDRAFSVATSLCLLFLISSLSGITPDSHNQLVEGGQGDIENPIITSYQMTELSELRTTLRTAGQSNNNHSWTWVNEAGGSTSADRGTSIVTDSSGNVFVTGYFSGTSSFGSISLTSNGGEDIFVAKLQSNGTWLWAVKAGSSTNDRANDIEIDTEGNAFLTGYIGSGTATFGSHSDAHTNTVARGAFVAKIDTNGIWQWVLADHSSGTSSEANGIAIDEEGGLFVVGRFSGAIVLDNHGPSQTSDSGIYSGFLIKLYSNGTSQFGKKVDSIDGDNCYFSDIAIDSDGNAYVAGNVQHGECSIGSHSIGGPGMEKFVAKLSSNTETWQWAAEYTDTSWGYALAITVDHNDNIYVTGKHNNYLFIGKLDSSGSWIWTENSVLGEGYDVDVDSSGDLYVTGSFEDTVNFGGTSLTSNGVTDIFVVKLDSDGNWIRAEKAGGPQTDNGDVDYNWYISNAGITIGSNDAAFVTGWIGGPANNWAAFGSQNLTSSAYSSIFVAKFSIDSDSDGWDDDEEAVCGTDPNDSSSSPIIDTDLDGICDAVDTDDDDDGIVDASDNCQT